MRSSPHVDRSKTPHSVRLAAGDIVDVVGKGEPSSESELRLACLTLLGVAIF
eukprot:SAG25_NODE_255_length_10943_cov_46.952047_12_plen_51_part_01